MNTTSKMIRRLRTYGWNMVFVYIVRKKLGKKLEIKDVSRDCPKKKLGLETFCIARDFVVYVYYFELWTQ